MHRMGEKAEGTSKKNIDVCPLYICRISTMVVHKLSPQPMLGNGLSCTLQKFMSRYGRHESQLDIIV